MDITLDTLIENPEIVSEVVNLVKPVILNVVKEALPLLEATGEYIQDKRIERFKKYEEAIGKEAALAIILAEMSQLKDAASNIKLSNSK